MILDCKCLKCKNDKLHIIEASKNLYLVECSKCGGQFKFNKFSLNLDKVYKTATQDIQETYGRLEYVGEDKRRLLVNNFKLRNVNNPLAVTVLQMLVSHNPK